MSFERTLNRFEPAAYAIFRIVTGFLFLWHGVHKLFGWPSTIPGLNTQAYVGGVIELVCGVLVMVGLFTRYAAFLAAGTMAVAYFQFHWKLHFDHFNFLPYINHGEDAVLYCFGFLLIAARGAGLVSVDSKLGK